MIKLSNSIPETIPDLTNPQAVIDFLTQVKLAIEELARKAKSIQTEVRTVNPSSNLDFEIEGEDIRTATREYTLVNGTVKYKALT